jgi:hypothetical protein
MSDQEKHTTPENFLGFEVPRLLKIFVRTRV